MPGFLVPACRRGSANRPVIQLTRSFSTPSTLTWSTTESRRRCSRLTAAPTTATTLLPKTPHCQSALHTACASSGSAAWMPLAPTAPANSIRHGTPSSAAASSSSPRTTSLFTHPRRPVQPAQQQSSMLLQTSSTRFTPASSPAASKSATISTISEQGVTHSHRRRPATRLDASFLAMARHRLSQKFSDSFHFDYCKDKPIREAAVIMLLCVVKNVPSVLFTVRGNNMRNHRGECSFPGGKRDPEDATILSTALREMYEEVSIEPDDVEVLGEYAAMPNKDCTMRVTPFVGYLRKPVDDLSTMVFNPDEVQKVFAVPVDDLLDPKKRTMVRFRDSKYMYPVWHVEDGLTIWGLTAFILDGVLRTIANEGPLGSTVIPEGSALKGFKPSQHSAKVI
ncbi:nudix (nucleoside diphosphate linked moiety X)-type motif 8 [Actinomortierella ambigua]|nr:nudix (nucleoside diphosphate linked moiety X)-type motif 8 [Actinomortierella ambigua]